jgi:hypothetical protein
VDASPDEDARTLARRVFSNLDALPEHDGNDMPTVRFTDSAYQDFWDWYCDTIKRADSEPSVHMEAHLAKYASLMPSIALVIELAEQASSGIPDIHTLTVSDTSSARAIAWCKYLETHARRIYGLVDDPVATARELLLKLPLMESPFRVRDVVRSNWSGLSDTKEVTTAAEQLCKYYCLDRQEVKTGGRPSALYYIHPDIQHRESKSKEGV